MGGRSRVGWLVPVDSSVPGCCCMRTDALEIPILPFCSGRGGGWGSKYAGNKCRGDAVEPKDRHNKWPPRPGMIRTGWRLTKGDGSMRDIIHTLESPETCKDEARRGANTPEAAPELRARRGRCPVLKPTKEEGENAEACEIADAAAATYSSVVPCTIIIYVSRGGKG